MLASVDGVDDGNGKQQLSEQLIVFRPRNVAAVLLVVAAFAAAAMVIVTAWQIITWTVIASFLAVALNPAARRLERKIHRHSLACTLVFTLTVVTVGSLAAVALPPLITQMHSLYGAAPRLLDELSRGHGKLGFLERHFHLAEHLRSAFDVNHTAAPAIAVARSVVSSVAALVTIGFLTLFMLLEGDAWIDRGFSLLPPPSQDRWRRAGSDIASMIVGYAVGNVLISVIAAAVTLVTLWIANVPFALPLAALVAVLDLVPIAGALVGGAIVSAVAFTVGTATGLVVLAVFICYHQIEGHLLQPLIYGRTVRLSPLVVLLAILLGARFDGILGAICAIPVAATVQIIVLEVIALRRESSQSSSS